MDFLASVKRRVEFLIFRRSSISISVTRNLVTDCIKDLESQKTKENQRFLVALKDGGIWLS